MKKFTLILFAAVALGCVVGEASPYSSAVLADSPTVYYRLGEASGPTATDSSGNANHGTYTTTPPPSGPHVFSQTGALAPIDTDTAVRFRGDLGTSYVDTPVVITPTAAWTVEFWLKPEVVGESKGIVSQNNGTGTGRSLVYQAYDGSGSYFSSFLGGTDTGWGGGYISTFGTYMHLALVHNGSGGLQWYTNGIAANSGSVTPEAANGTLVVGSFKDPASQAGLGFLRGTLDEVAIYTSALSGADVLEHYNATFVPEPSAVMMLGFGALLLFRRRA